MNEMEAKLVDLLLAVKKDKMFVFALTTFAREYDVVNEMVGLLEEVEFEDEHDLLDAIFLE